MSILISWLGPLRAICMAIDGVAFSLLDNAYQIVINLSTAELFQHETIRSITNNLYILIGVVAFFRLALVLVNAIIDPEKLNEKGKGLSNIFFRVVGMVILLAVTPFLFQLSYELQGKIVGGDPDKNIIFKTILGDNANMGGDNAGKALQNIALSSLITVNENYYESFTPLECVSNGDGSCTNQGGYVYGGECDWDNCYSAVSLYNDLYVNEDMSPTKLAKWAGVSKKIDGEEVYVYDYMMIVTTVVGIFMTYIIISFAIDIAVRMFELLVLEVLSPLFIATFVDPKSSQSGPFKNWLSAVGKSYANLYIKLAILALIILLISLVNQSKIFNSMNDLSGWTKIFVVIGLLIFAKKAPKWIMDMIGIKGDESGLGGLSIGKKLGGMALAGGLVNKGKELKDKALKSGGDFLKRRAGDAALRMATGIGAHSRAMKNSKGSGEKYSDRLKKARQASAAERANMKTEQRNAEPRMFEKLQSAYDRGAGAVDPDYKNRRETKIENLEAKALGKMEAAIKSGAMLDSGTIDVMKDNKEKRKKAKALSANNKLELDENGDRKKIVSPVNGEKVNINPQGEKELQAAINYSKNEFDAYDAYGRNLAAYYGYSSDSNGRVLDSSGKVIAASMAELGAGALSFTGQLAVKELVAKNLQKDVSNYNDNREALVKSQQDLATDIQRLNDTLKVMKDQQQNNPQIADAYSTMEKFSKQQAILTEKSQGLSDLRDSMEKLLAGRNFNDLSENEQSRYIQINANYKNMIEDYNSSQTEFRNISKKYSEAQKVVENFEKQYGIDQMRENIETSKRNVEEFSSYVHDAEERFKNTVVIEYDDDGAPKKNSDGSYVTFNPYNVKVDGVEYSPKDSYGKIKDIINVLEIKSGKASEKAKEKLEEELKKLEKTGDE